MASASATLDSLLEVKKSKVMIDLVAFPVMEWYDDPGWGLFQKFDGMISIKFVGDDIISVRRDSLKKGSQQWKYAVDSGYDEDYVIVPTKASIDSCKVPFPFRVQHSTHYPSHKLDWVEDPRDYPHSYPVLKPVRTLNKGDEITFDYNK